MSEMENTENSEMKEKKPIRNLQKTILDNFSKLANPHEHVRVKCAANLVKYLAENRETEEGSNETRYALKRLIRGLGAPSDVARMGYYTVLSALFKLNPSTDLSNILVVVKEELRTSGKNSDGENADILAGQILVCGSIIRGCLFETASSEQRREIIRILLTASKERSYLGLFGYSFIVEVLSLVPDITDDKETLEQLSAEVSKPWGEQTLDTLHLLLRLRLSCPKIFNKKFIKKTLNTPDIVCEETIDKFCSILMSIPRASALNHPIFETVTTIVPSSLLHNFFNGLDKHLKTPNRNRLLVFIKVLTMTFSTAIKNTNYILYIPDILTSNFLIQLLGYFRTFKGKQRDTEYHEYVQKLFSSLVEICQKESVQSDTKVAVIKKLLFHPGTFVFEKVTRSKLIQQITMSLDTEGVKNLAALYRGVIDGSQRIDSENNSDIWVNNDRLYSAYLMIKLMNLPAMRLDNDWKVEQLTFLMELTLLREEKNINFGRELSESLRNAFFGALDMKLSKLDDLHLILLKLVQSLDFKLSSEKADSLLRIPLSPEAYELWKKCMHTVKKIEKKHKKSRLTSVFLTLFLHMGLQLFNEVKLATDSLQELFSCYEKIKSDKKNKHIMDNKILEQTLVDNENDPLWIEVVTDLFLNLLSHNSHLLRSIINSVFPHLCQYMKSTSIHQVLSVLDPKNDENTLSTDQDGSSDESNEEDTSDDEENNSEDDDEENNSEDDAEEDDEEEHDDEADEETATDKLRIALHQVLLDGNNSDDESIDLDQLSDTEGERLDKALADAFKQFKPNHGKRKKQTKVQESLTHFRIRALDLVEIYLNSTPSMILALEIMIPLLQAVEFSIKDEHQKPLNDRLRNILKKLLGLKKFHDFEGVTDDVLVDLLRSLLDKGSKNVMIVQDMGEQIADCCIFVVKCSDILRNSEEISSKIKKKLKSNILEVFCGELYQFFTKRDCLTPYVLFKNLLQMSWEENIGLAITLLDFLFSTEIRQYKKSQVAELLKIFYSNHRFLSQLKSKVDSEMNEKHKEFSSNVVDFFKSLSLEPERKDIKEKFICHFFNLLAAIKNSPLSQEPFSWSIIAQNLREYRSYKSFSKDAKLAFNKLCKALGVSNTVAMKLQVTRFSTPFENEEKTDQGEKTQNGSKKKHKRKNNETLKLKKEAKKLRLSSLSKGLGEVEFDKSKINNVTYEDETIELPRIEKSRDHVNGENYSKKKLAYPRKV